MKISIFQIAFLAEIRAQRSSCPSLFNGTDESGTIRNQKKLLFFENFLFFSFFHFQSNTKINNFKKDVGRKKTDLAVLLTQNALTYIAGRTESMPRFQKTCFLRILLKMKKFYRK